MNIHAFISQWRKKSVNFYSDIIYIAKLPSKITLISTSNLCCMSTSFIMSTLDVIDVENFCHPDERKLDILLLKSAFLHIYCSYSPHFSFTLTFCCCEQLLEFYGNQDFPRPSRLGGCRRNHFSNNNPRPAQWLEHNQ